MAVVAVRVAVVAAGSGDRTEGLTLPDAVAVRKDEDKEEPSEEEGYHENMGWGHMQGKTTLRD